MSHRFGRCGALTRVRFKLTGIAIFVRLGDFEAIGFGSSSVSLLSPCEEVHRADK